MRSETPLSISDIEIRFSELEIGQMDLKLRNQIRQSYPILVNPFQTKRSETNLFTVSSVVNQHEVYLYFFHKLTSRYFRK